MFQLNAQMRLVQNVKFPVSLLVSESKTEGNPFEMYDILSGGTVEKIGAPAWTETGKLSAGARIGDPTTGRVVFLNGLGENAKLIKNLRIGDVVHAVGERRMFNGAVTFRLIGFLEEAPIIEHGRFISNKEAVPAEHDYAVSAVEGEIL